MELAFISVFFVFQSMVWIYTLPPDDHLPVFSVCTSLILSGASLLKEIAFDLVTFLCYPFALLAKKKTLFGIYPVSEYSPVFSTPLHNKGLDLHDAPYLSPPSSLCFSLHSALRRDLLTTLLTGTS